MSRVEAVTLKLSASLPVTHQIHITQCGRGVMAITGSWGVVEVMGEMRFEMVV